MAIRPGRREKLAGGIIVVLVGIALLHYFIFQPKHGEFARAQAEYNNVEQRYRTMEMVPTTQINKYEEETKARQEELKKVLKELNPCYVPYFADQERMQKEFLDLVGQIDNLRTEYPNVDWAFLGPQGWDFARQLPDPVRRGQIAIDDLIDRIRGHDRLINYITNPQEKALRQQEYLQYLLQLGVNMNRVLSEPFKAAFGELVPRLYLAYHAQLIGKAVPADKGLTIKQLLFYLRPGFDVPSFFEGLPLHVTNKQLETLLDILKMAAANNIETVASVTILQHKNVRPRADVEAGQPTPTPTPQPMMEEWGFFMGAEGGPMGGFPGMFPGQQQARPAEPEVVAGKVTGYKIRFQAQNSNAMRFLNELTTSPRPYVMDDLAVNSMKDGRVDVIVTIIAYISISGVCD
ncbi:MAG: hypothetical protein Kow0059_11480 [Candidatus Sumerlaeia bacterium]